MSKIRKHGKKNTSAPYGPGQDISVAKKQANQFPGIGTTLSSYGNNKQAQVKQPRKFFNKHTLKRLALGLVCLVLISGILLGGKFIYNLQKAFGGNIFGIIHSTKLKGEDSGRVNILLAGDSADDPNHQGADLTDSIMVISINTKNDTAWMLSIPRDLWVKIPNNGYQKINAAYEDGNSINFSANGYPKGGMGQLEQIVAQKLAIPIDYYALINYSAFKQAVNAVGGITVNVNSPDPRGYYDSFAGLKLSNGTQTINGTQALAYARARGDNAGGDYSYGFVNADFDRTTHQRQMLLALTSKAASTSVIANPLALNKLFDALGNNVKTDLTLSDGRRLYDLSKKLPQSKIKSLSLNNDNGNTLLASYLSSNGQSALIPKAGLNNYSDIQSFVARYTSNNPVVIEGAKVAVLNGTNVYGLANLYKNKLTAQHINVDYTGDTYSTATTQIIDLSNNKMPHTKQTLTQLIGNNFTTADPFYGRYDADFIVVLGTDKASVQ